jgi:hypothetical protein
MLYAKRRGGFNIYVVRPGKEHKKPTRGEQELFRYVEKWYKEGVRGPVDDYILDYLVINDGTEKDLFEQLYNDLIPYLAKWLNPTTI